MKRILISLLCLVSLLGAPIGLAQGGGQGGQKKPTQSKEEQERLKAIETERIRRMDSIQKQELEGVQVRLKDIGRFRGVRPNSIMGVGVVFGLQGTGDTRRNPQVARAISNYLRSIGQDVDAATIEPRNGALVMITAELPPFATNGQPIDITVSSIGDATNLRGGVLLRTELYATGDNETIYAVAQGNVSIGSVGAQAGGNSNTVGFLTAGRIPGGALVERGAPTRLVYDGFMYLDLYDADFTSAERVEAAIRAKYPEMNPVAQNGGSIQLTLPDGISATAAMAKVEQVVAKVDNKATIVINEKTGAIAIGGNVRIAPAAISVGTITVRIQEEVSVSQPNPFSQTGTTQTVQNQQVDVEQGESNVAVLAPNTTVADLARIFQELRLRPFEIINVLQLLKEQGALKARVIIQ